MKSLALRMVGILVFYYSPNHADSGGTHVLAGSLASFRKGDGTWHKSAYLYEYIVMHDGMST